MNRPPIRATVPPAHVVADKIFSALERFLHVEAVGGIVLVLSAAVALVWANSSAAHSYHVFWDQPFTLSIGAFTATQSLHFLVNDALMSVFFLVVGMEIRREMHEGALAQVRAATLPLAAAVGGVLVPAILFVSLNANPDAIAGWAVPTATDIAFAVGVLALLGKAIPLSIRVLLLALAIIDDIAAVIIIAVFYGSGLEVMAFAYAALAVAAVLGLQAIGVGNAFAYVLPGALLWFAFHEAGIHPSLTGVVLGLMTPVVSRTLQAPAILVARRAIQEVYRRMKRQSVDPHELSGPLKALREAQRELLPPVVRVQMTLHPWVAYGVMPLFALANAGVTLDEVDLAATATINLVLSVGVALVFGKPLGIFLGSWIAVRLGWCQLPPGVNWVGILLVGILGGIGFTMSIFIATLAFSSASLLAAAKLGVLAGSALSGIAGLALGYFYFRRAAPRALHSHPTTEAESRAQ